MSIDAPQLSLVFVRRHMERPCATPPQELCEKLFQGVEMQSWVDLVHFGNWRKDLISRMLRMKWERGDISEAMRLERLEDLPHHHKM